MVSGRLVLLLWVSLAGSATLAGSRALETDPLSIAVETLEGTTTKLAEVTETPWIAAVFLATECPVANRYVPAMNALARDFEGDRVTLVGVYCDPNESRETLQEHRREFQLAFPVVVDGQQHLVEALGITYTPETAVFHRDGSLVYRGRIDDRFMGFGRSRPEPVVEDLRNILSTLQAGEEVPFHTVRGFGCAIHRPVEPPAP